MINVNEINNQLEKNEEEYIIHLYKFIIREIEILDYYIPSNKQHLSILHWETYLPLKGKLNKLSERPAI
ncbi:hypothetical protein M0811_14631 [Anaeramoeba ignava]|uniref:Uncharacterized protein n=1 Tax=Anaeramoeba ignava TaxID=1746090 RepID=A0A9Q0RFN1_ANAIG|nr:hypothetical protein M0811_14631 [Anaeramoeba ignava]